MQKKIIQDIEIFSPVLEELLSPEEEPFPDSIPPINRGITISQDSAGKHIQDIIKLSDNPHIPFLVLESDLTIRHISPATENLFKDYYTITHKPFFNIFPNSLDQNEIQDMIIALKSFERGYSWSGILKHRKQTAKTMLTRTSFIPFFSEEKAVSGFMVYFDDITNSYNSQLKSTYKSILEAAKLKDNDTGLHDERVSYYCKKMAEYLFAIQKYPQIDPDFIENIGFLSAMHDVGKIGTPDYILQKPGKLDNKEWEIMREHTINGTFILSSYPVPMAKEIALSHHEWWNGTGYPFRLEGEMIPLSARIVTIADVYDALRMKRTYKPEFSHSESVEIIASGSGTQFDPELIAVFLRIHQDYEDIWNLLKDTLPARPASRDRNE